MTVVRLSIATAAVAALLAVGALVALAAPKAVANAASPKAGAGHAVYCPGGEKKRRQQQLNAFIRTMQAARKTFFATHPKASDRTRFLQQQQAQLHALQRALGQCS
jgi:Spy/CpxP family protein refolding chaperone